MEMRSVSGEREGKERVVKGSRCDMSKYQSPKVNVNYCALQTYTNKKFKTVRQKEHK